MRLEKAACIIYDKGMIRPGISAQLRQARARAGLSLHDVARRAGTSAATIHRYESGWARFELYTLEKLARALECDLDVSFAPRPRTARPDRARLVSQIRRLFWDRPLRTTDLERYPEWVAARVLEYGALEDVRCIVAWFGRERLLEIVAGLHLSGARTRRLWRGLLAMEGRGCTRKFSREEADGFWTGSSGQATPA